YFSAVMWAADNNIVYGIGNDMLAPNTSITREDTAAIVYRYLKAAAADDNNTFADSEEISTYALDAVNTLSAEGIINGYPDNTFRPKNTITRAEAAAVLYGVNKR
ncbi:MAG: S-layer homology domain-containing protein, partial [Firmicutes bacterium]|nr:S-layer homology domain-containing protein [Bacillota bacterium]